ncbi:MAG TPA: DUF3862 domain-containing protein [Accumulibacter sp.]|nr:DUF3862 domain-containing protein [Accumulibacter sp.]HMY05465.1 DUF3862 domain-containing protein [Accumulibacter sp.]HNC17100.1 DUF3862 domain-containing protein [Accumulibacter sp.]HND81194.1 DUF3862 domain-containing protein [Accumulibacter sp.]HNE12863.1 DUF3862 domain-containing protein [Accumulibacter sp.]
MMFARPPIAWIILPLINAALLIGCNQKLSLENYDKLKIGQSYDEVKQIVGEPAQCDEVLGVRSCRWGDDKRGILAAFLAGKVVMLSANGLQ